MNRWFGNASTPTPELASTPETQPEEDAATSASSETRATRSVTSDSHEFLTIPYSGRLPSRDVARERLRRASRSRTPSPRPRDSDVFNYDPGANRMDEDTVQRLMEAAIRATQTSSTQQVQSLRKPDLPAFDRKNVEIRIKRVQAA